MKIKAVLFDLYGTLLYVEDEVSDDEASNFLFSRCYEVSLQQLNAARYFVTMVDYPKYGYEDWSSLLMQMFWRLGIKAGFGKSNPRMYMKVSNVLNVKHEEFIVIGDDVQYDALLPKKLGMHTILLDRKGERHGQESSNVVVKDLGEAVEILLSHFK